MKKYQVYQHYGGSIIREIEANSPEEAEEKMLQVDNITLEEMMDCVWDNAECQEEIKEA